MAETLGILVNSDGCLDHLVGLTQAAARKGLAVIIFLTHRGVLLTRQEKFAMLDGLAEISLCRTSFEAHGLDDGRPVPGVPPQNFINQSGHAHLVERADRYVVL